MLSTSTLFSLLSAGLISAVPVTPGSPQATPINNEADIATQPDTASTPKFTRYVSIGDSYSAGPGSDGNEVTSPGPSPPYAEHCLNHDGSWPWQLQEALQLPQGAFRFSACSGYTTQQIRDIEILHPQSGFESPDLVSLTLGGNDGGGFEGIVDKCSMHMGSCDDALENAQKVLDNDMDKELELTITAAATHNLPSGSKRTVIVQTYPEFYNEDDEFEWGCFTSHRDRKNINKLSKEMNDKINAAVQKVNAAVQSKGATVKLVDANAAFDSHRFCDPGSQAAWFQDEPSWRTLSNGFYLGLFHPTTDGHKAMMKQALQVLGVPEPVAGAGGAGGAGGLLGSPALSLGAGSTTPVTPTIADDTTDA